MKSTKRLVLAVLISLGLIVSSSIHNFTFAGTMAADEYYSLISKYTVNQPYEAFSLLVEANKTYPSDSRFVDGLNNRAKTILEWSRGSHAIGHYDAAIAGYDTVINVQTIQKSIRDYAKRQKDQALNKKSPTSPDEYNTLGTKYNINQPYEAFAVYGEAVVAYPADQRFKDGLNRNAAIILEYSIGSHKASHFDAAIYGYQTILSNNMVNSDIQNKSNLYLGYARQNKVFYSADEYSSMASKLVDSKPYDALSLYTEAIKMYPNDTRFKDGIAKSAKIIAVWSFGSHKAGNYSSAISGYQVVINSLAPDYIRSFATRLCNRAKNNQDILYVNDYVNLVSNYSLDKPYDVFGLSSEGLILDSQNTQLISKLNDSAKIILSWSYGSHNRGNYDGAKIGYNALISTPNVADYIYNAAYSLNGLANKKSLPMNQSGYLSQGTLYLDSNPYQALDIYSQGATIFGVDGFASNINKAASTILEWSKGSHRRSNFSSALDGYNEITSNPYVKAEIYGVASALKILAAKCIPYSEDGRYVVSTSYSTTHADFVNSEMTYGQPLTYRNGSWVNAERSDVDYYSNPDNFTGNDYIYQFLVLSGQAGISESELNNLLVDKGMLKQQGAAFIKASRLCNVNEIYLVSHSLLETGNGQSKLAQGVSYNGQIVYNMYGVGAYDSPFSSEDGNTPNPTAWGAKFAYDHGWFTPEAAIVGGAQFIGKGYINNGQDTLYKMRWNPSNINHQYATDVAWATKQVYRIKNLYDKVQNSILRFDIPNFK